MMSLPKLLVFLLAFSITIFTNIAIAWSTTTSNKDEVANSELRTPSIDNGGGRLLKQEMPSYGRPSSSMKCDLFPRICRAKGSSGPDCCKKRCVNVMNDRLNCGFCGNKCKYGQICCRGSCVNPMFDRRHCGGCNQRCGKGDFCAYGMCNYA